MLAPKSRTTLSLTFNFTLYLSVKRSLTVQIVLLFMNVRLSTVIVSFLINISFMY